MPAQGGRAFLSTLGSLLESIEAVFVSFFLTAPQSGDGERVNGSLHLQWVIPPRARTGGITGGDLRAITPGPVKHGGLHVNAGEVLGEPAARGPEQWVEELERSMKPEQRQMYASSLPRKAVSHDEAALKAGESPHAIAFLPTRGTGRPRVRSVPNAEKKAEDQKVLDALHQIYGPNIPGAVNAGPWTGGKKKGENVRDHRTPPVRDSSVAASNL